MVVSIAITILLYNIFFMALSYFSRQFAFPRTVLLMQVIPQLLLLLLWRSLLWKYQNKHSSPLKIFIIAKSDEAELIKSRIPFKQYNWTVAGEHHAADSKINLDEILSDEKLDILLLGRSLSPGMRKQLLIQALTKGLKVYVIPDMYDMALKLSLVNQVEDMKLMEVNPENITLRSQVLKRAIDITISTAALPLIAIISIVVSACIYLETGRPILYKQERVTAGGKIFSLYKFRTMYNNAEKETGPVQARDGDPRITKVGRVLRALRLDELPQIINVLKGDMSLVGPRPERPYFIKQFEKNVPGYSLRHKLKAGITGLAQVNGRYSTSPEDKLIMDLEYGLNHSIWLDLKLMLQTIKVVFIKKSST
ncbi:exopolysaccharide biosynthesis polyprenyl glycosylphosphotransferase [Desulfohalotomaculum tongense]|nr:exopolysaccharide biosynthesis polyprenyl glycosylphosphotransferase [Desulforadius tongensis]